VDRTVPHTTVCAAPLSRLSSRPLALGPASVVVCFHTTLAPLLPSTTLVLLIHHPVTAVTTRRLTAPLSVPASALLLPMATSTSRTVLIVSSTITVGVTTLAVAVTGTGTAIATAVVHVSVRCVTAVFSVTTTVIVSAAAWIRLFHQLWEQKLRVVLPHTALDDHRNFPDPLTDCVPAPGLPTIRLGPCNGFQQQVSTGLDLPKVLAAP
jgi:hypothetical protein